MAGSKHDSATGLRSVPGHGSKKIKRSLKLNLSICSFWNVFSSPLHWNVLWTGCFRWLVLCYYRMCSSTCPPFSSGQAWSQSGETVARDRHREKSQIRQTESYNRNTEKSDCEQKEKEQWHKMWGAGRSALAAQNVKHDVCTRQGGKGEGWGGKPCSGTVQANRFEHVCDHTKLSFSVAEAKRWPFNNTTQFAVAQTSLERDIYIFIPACHI